MTVTEQQAKMKWCPMTQQNKQFSESKCIGSECMMWEWDKNTKAYEFRLCDDVNATVEPDRSAQSIPASWIWNPAEDGEDAFWIESQDDNDARRLGRCGLSKP